MGCTNSKQKDFYDILVNKYGQDDVIQLAVNTSKVHFIESSQQQIINIIQRKLSETKTNQLSSIENLKMEIDRKYQKSINRIQQANPKAIAKAEKIHKSRLDNLMGYNDVAKKISEFTEQSKRNLDKQETQSLATLKSYLHDMEQSTRKDIPNLKYYERLQEEDQQKFLKTAKKKNKKIIKDSLTQIQREISEKCNYDNFQSKLLNIVTKKQLAQISDMADNLFLAGEQKVKGSTDCATC